MAHAEPANSGPVETPPAHTEAYMDMASRRGMFGGFGVLTAWGSLLVIMVVGYATFTLTMGVPWIGAMIGLAVFGIAVGLMMNLGGAWVATVIGLCVLGVILEILVWLGSTLLRG